MASRLAPSEPAAFEAIAEKVAAHASCCLPGVIEEFDPGPPQIAKVTPAIQRKVIEDGKARYVAMPLILNVPVVVPFAQTAGLLVTLPLKKGDEGLIVFADRMIDNFVEKGGCCNPPECCGPDNDTTEPRAHSLTDAIFIPGIISKPQSVPDWSLEAVELRNRDRSCFISLREDKNIVIQTTEGVAINAGKSVVVTAGEKFEAHGQEVHLDY